MLKELKRILKGGLLVADYVYDNAHRVITGLPRLSRSQISGQLLLGSQYNRWGLKKLKAMGVTGIVNMRTTNTYGDAAHQGINYLHLPTTDNTAPPLDDLIKGADFIDREIGKGGIVYVHCRQGLGRGPTIAMAYLIKTGLTYEQAYEKIRSVRRFINPQGSQVKRLKELQAWYESTDKTRKESV
jgi:hypothetical protein